MKNPDWLLPLLVGVIFALQSWILVEIVNLKVSVAEIKGRLNITQNTKENEHENHQQSLVGSIARGVHLYF